MQRLHMVKPADPLTAVGYKRPVLEAAHSS